MSGAYGIAWDDDPDNPNPHAWNMHPDRYETEAAAIKSVEAAVRGWEEDYGDEDGRFSWIVVWVNPEVPA